MQAEILTPWRYAAVTVGCRMTHRTRDFGIDRIRVFGAALACSESLPRTRLSICPLLLPRRYRIGIGLTGGPEPVRYGWGRTYRLTLTTEITPFKRTVA